ncbi:hypothetical protein BDV97DRAFT_196012 [Delphinella strobiligena]|nr:hypothetical protein BDV97DRAFT_196012 [Delphinella strobiligena]
MAATDDLCAVCNERGKLCVRCNNILYCTYICQTADWSCHQLVCRSFTQFGDAARPSTKSIRAILFPVAESKPRFIWLNTTSIRDDDDSDGYERPDVMNLLGDDDPISDQRLIGRSTLLDRNLRHTIALKMRDTFSIDGSKPNQSIMPNIKFLPSTLTWKGPFVAFGLKGLSTNPSHCEDLDTRDFKSLMDYFSTYGDQSVGRHQRSATEKIQGVQINCQGQLEQTGEPQFQAVKVPQQHPVFFEGKKSQIAEKIGIPLLAYSLPVRQSWKNTAVTGI